MVATSEMMRILRGETRENEWIFVMNEVRRTRKAKKNKEHVDVAVAN